MANTHTLNGGYGRGVVVEDAGFLLNNEMDDFAAKHDVPNQFGVVGATRTRYSQASDHCHPCARPLR